MKTGSLIDIKLLRLVINDICKRSRECFELKNTPTVRKLKNANKSCRIVPLWFLFLQNSKQQAAVLGHHEVRDARDGNVRASRHSRGLSASPHNKSRLHFDYSLVKKGAILNTIYHYYKRDDHLKVAIRNNRKPLEIRLPRLPNIWKTLKFRPMTMDWTTDHWTLDVTFEGQFFLIRLL